MDHHDAFQQVMTQFLQHRRIIVDQLILSITVAVERRLDCDSLAVKHPVHVGSCRVLL